jgi:hypothetical protein
VNRIAAGSQANDRSGELQIDWNDDKEASSDQLYSRPQLLPFSHEDIEFACSPDIYRQHPYWIPDRIGRRCFSLLPDCR